MPFVKNKLYETIVVKTIIDERSGIAPMYHRRALVCYQTALRSAQARL